jgi:hypothetical protein
VTAARRGLLLLILLGLAAVASAPRTASARTISGERSVFLIRVSPASFEDLLARPQLANLAHAGGAALLSYGGTLDRHVGGERTPGVDDEIEYVIGVRAQLVSIGEVIEDRVRRFGARRVLVIVVSLVRTAGMERAKDQLYPVIVADGDPRELFGGGVPMRTLTSDSTRRIGVVSDADIVATIARFTALPLPEEGSPIRVVDEPVPFELHERYLAQRRMSVPIGIAAGLYVTLAGLFGLALLALGRRVPPRLAHFAAWLAMSVPVLGVALLAAGHLPTLSYATVMPFLIGVTVVGTLAFVPLRRFGALVPPAAIGAAVLAYFVVEAALGWTAALTPFHGGSELDGGRFYGLPNAFIGLLIGASLYVAHRMNAIVGFVLIVAAALFAGLPGVGANLGGAVALFAAAGLWLAQRRLGRIGWKGAVLTAVVVVVGVAVVLLAHRFLTSSPTHVTRFEESPGGLSGIWRTFADRLLVGWRLIVRNPFAIVPVLGLPIVLVALLRPPALLREPLAAHPAWRDALLVMIVASVVAYVANDSGAAACGLGFALGLGGLFYVSLIEGTWKMTAT